MMIVYHESDFGGYFSQRIRFALTHTLKAGWLRTAAYNLGLGTVPQRDHETRALDNKVLFT
jgi:hypothetical protein